MGCQNAISKLQLYFESHRQQLEIAASKEDLTLFQLNLRGLAAFRDAAESSAKGNGSAAHSARDAEMANAFQTMIETFYPNKKSIIWAHNAHIQKKSSADTNPEHRFFTSMGEHLSHFFQEAYVPIGLLSHKTGIHWGSVSTTYQAPTGDNVVENKLKGLNIPFQIIDLRPRSCQKLLDPKTTYIYGFDGDSSSEARITDQFTALIYLDESPGMTVVDRKKP
jgi:erythromycin esterase-like protein